MNFSMKFKRYVIKIVITICIILISNITQIFGGNDEEKVTSTNKDCQTIDTSTNDNAYMSVTSDDVYMMDDIPPSSVSRATSPLPPEMIPLPESPLDNIPQRTSSGSPIALTPDLINRDLPESPKVFRSPFFINEVNILKTISTCFPLNQLFRLRHICTTFCNTINGYIIEQILQTINLGYQVPTQHQQELIAFLTPENIEHLLPHLNALEPIFNRNPSLFPRSNIRLVVSHNEVKLTLDFFLRLSQINKNALLYDLQSKGVLRANYGKSSDLSDEIRNLPFTLNRQQGSLLFSYLKVLYQINQLIQKNTNTMFELIYKTPNNVFTKVKTLFKKSVQNSKYQPLNLNDVANSFVHGFNLWFGAHSNQPLMPITRDDIQVLPNDPTIGFQNIYPKDFRPDDDPPPVH